METTSSTEWKRMTLPMESMDKITGFMLCIGTHYPELPSIHFKNNRILGSTFIPGPCASSSIGYKDGKGNHQAKYTDGTTNLQGGFTIESFTQDIGYSLAIKNISNDYCTVRLYISSDWLSYKIK